MARSIRVRAIGGSGAPYPFPRGRGPDVRRQRRGRRGQGLLDLLKVKIGDRVWLSVGGTPLIVAHRRQDRRARPRRAGAVARRRQSLAAKERGAARVLGPGVEEGRPTPADVRDRLLTASGEGLEIQRVVKPRRTTVDHQGGHRRADRRAGADRPGQPADRQRAGAA
ncbi:hypothetical protein [Nonomuraea dietziae]|uniref:hypothetical protein n=1 Tax=Nonomuraea dietziae TaxID=65515 RepID=UPI0031D2D525